MVTFANVETYHIAARADVFMATEANGIIDFFRMIAATIGVIVQLAKIRDDWRQQEEFIFLFESQKHPKNLLHLSHFSTTFGFRLRGTCG